MIITTRVYNGTYWAPGDASATVKVADNWSDLIEMRWGDNPQEIIRHWYEAHCERLVEVPDDTSGVEVD